MMAGRSVRTFTVLPQLPGRLQALQQLAYNMWWCWNHEAVSLFRRIDADLFDHVENSPVKLLGAIDQGRLEQLCRDDGFLAHMDRVQNAFDNYLSATTWYEETYGDATPCRIAYFSAEFGLHESVPIYSGGLGVLAGDHLKSASDLGLPLVAVGLFYRESYFRQRIGRDGWQHAEYVRSPAELLPAQPALTPSGQPSVAEVPRWRETS